MNFAGAYGQVSVTLIAAAGLSFLPFRAPRLIGWLSFCCALPAVGPFAFGLAGLPSFTLTQLAILRLIVADRKSACSSTFASCLVLATGLIFYPLALGVGPFDPFDLGYASPLLPICLICLGLIFAFRREPIPICMISGDMIAYGLGLFSNLWSACLDPFLVMLALLQILSTRFKGRSV